MPDKPGLLVDAPFIHVEDANGALLLVHPKYESILRDNSLCGFERLFSAVGDVRLNKKGLAEWRHRLRLTLSDVHAEQRFFLKRYDRPPIGAQLRRLLAGQSYPAAAEWCSLHRVASLGIRVSEPVAVGTDSGLFRQRSLILTAEVPGESLEKWIPAALRDGRLDCRMKRTLTERLAALAAALHHAGLVHRDLYLAHIFVRPTPNGDCELTLIDLQRVLAPRWRLRRWIVKDLAALNYSTPLTAPGVPLAACLPVPSPMAISLTDRLRFLKRYLNVDKLSARDKALIRAIVSKTARIARHSAKHGLG